VVFWTSRGSTLGGFVEGSTSLAQSQVSGATKDSGYNDNLLTKMMSPQSVCGISDVAFRDT
jgi:hypothetical protein